MCEYERTDSSQNIVVDWLCWRFYQILFVFREDFECRLKQREQKHGYLASILKWGHSLKSQLYETFILSHTSLIILISALCSKAPVALMFSLGFVIYFSHRQSSPALQHRLKCDKTERRTHWSWAQEYGGRGEPASWFRGFILCCCDFEMRFWFKRKYHIEAVDHVDAWEDFVMWLLCGFPVPFLRCSSVVARGFWMVA